MKVNNAYSQSCATCCRRFVYLFLLAPMVWTRFMHSNGVSGPAREKKNRKFFFSVKEETFINIPGFVFRLYDHVLPQLYSIYLDVFSWIDRWNSLLDERVSFTSNTNEIRSCGSLNGYKRYGAGEGDENDAQENKKKLIKKNDCVASWLGIFNFPLCTIFLVWNEWRRRFLGRSGIR